MTRLVKREIAAPAEKPVVKAAEPQARTRTRPAAKPMVKPTKDQIAQAKAMFSHNEASNHERSACERVKKALYASMVDANTAPFEIAHVNAKGEKIICDVKRDRSMQMVVDTEKLRKLIDAETFNAIISTTVKAVTDAVGTNILNQCLKPSYGTETVYVVQRK